MRGSAPLHSEAGLQVSCCQHSNHCCRDVLVCRIPWSSQHRGQRGGRGVTQPISLASAGDAVGPARVARQRADIAEKNHKCHLSSIAAPCFVTPSGRTLEQASVCVSTLSRRLLSFQYRRIVLSFKSYAGRVGRASEGCGRRKQSAWWDVANHRCGAAGGRRTDRRRTTPAACGSSSRFFEAGLASLPSVW